MANQLITALAQPIAETIDAALNAAKDDLENVKKAALINMNYEFDEEIARLSELREHNPSIREEEVDYLLNQKTRLNDIIENAEPNLDSVRVVVNNPR